ncbi:MAG TPA: membrane-bound lytic murein transglycosylase MltF [Sulfurimonas sp. UBA12504]|nr:MAG: lytic transglycosylase F [Sulfurimonas sp. GWF2_37_8]DAB30403.1 MAG TPA: membrane-bound lytic murein transglycosylase MltF [Sulfurimonas sp. UBA12504]
MNKTPNGFSLVLFALSFFLFGWLGHSVYAPIIETQYPTILEKIKKEKKLNVVLLNSPSTYYIGTDGEQGFEYDLLKAYADYLGVGLNITVAHTTKEAIELSKNPNVHITSAALAKTPLREDSFNFGPTYLEVQQQVICYRGMLNTKNFPNDVEGLAGLKIMIGEDTSYSETVQALQNEGFDLNVTLTSEYSTEELLQKVSQNEIDCTIADSNIYSINLRYFPEIAQAFTISGREQLAWVLAPNSKGLKASMYEWLNSFNQSGAMAALKDHHSGYIMFFDYYNTKMFYHRIKARLPKFQELFSQASEKYKISWILLAAISYQESHWNPSAKSYTGVRGLMMLTNNTAAMLGIQDRVDPSQSIDGGTRHIVEMLKLVPPEVEGENRLKFALAAYNVGMAHVEDAMKLAKKLNLNETIWNDLKKVLPLLAQKKYYKDLKYGYARGEEPVKYVESIYNYKDILENALEESSRVMIGTDNTIILK